MPENIEQQIESLNTVENFFRENAALLGEDRQQEIQSALQELSRKRQELMRRLVPEYVYINLPSAFESIVITMPSANIHIPENPQQAPNYEGLVATYKNNGTYRVSNNEYLRVNDYYKKPTLVSAMLGKELYAIEDILQNREQLLHEFFIRRLEGEENVQRAIELISGTETQKGKFLYRAINLTDWRLLQDEGTLCFSHLDRSANFESESMYKGDHSQVKHYVAQEGYAGKIIRWPVEHPLFYRLAGMNPPRIIPLYPHFIRDIEISSDKGETFEKFEKSK